MARGDGCGRVHGVRAMVNETEDGKDGTSRVVGPGDAGAPTKAPPAGGGAPDLATLLRTGEKWGYVDDDGGIHVRAGKFNEDRLVARVPPSKRADTLATLLLRFQELEDRFAALTRELRRSRNAGRNLKSLQSFAHWVQGAEAIGDYDSLLGRAHAEIAKIEGRLAQGEAAKLELVERAEALADSDKWKSAGEVMDELMQEWKCAPSAGREHDETLWERFNEARRTFFTRRSEHFAELKKSRAQVREVKEALIVRAEELAPSTDYDATFAAMQELLEEWKQAGSAGRDIDDQLWERFHAARDPFFERRKAHFAEQRRRTDDRPRRGDDRPRGRGPAGPRRRDDRGPDGPPTGRSRSGKPPVLRSSLADLVGPLKDLFPAERESDKTEPGKSSRKQKTEDDG
ncbi:MAG: DUF349 domain-containing protein [Acidobacteria bacterium]|jgi:hypothetical protein|nr:DUF349 domain-containing protein [Acidobacteriota bacterium]